MELIGLGQALNKHLVFDGLHPVEIELGQMERLGIVSSFMRENGTNVQKRFRFNNGYGVSLIKGFMSFGNWELAVIKFEPIPKNRFPKSKRLRKKYHKRYSDHDLIYNTSITNDVKRYSVEDIEGIKHDIETVKHFRTNQF